MFEHPEIAVSDLGDTPIRTRLEHVSRHEGGLGGLHRLMAEDPRFPVVANVLDVFQGDARVIETELDRVVWKSTVVFLARESLFFNRGYQLAVLDQRRRGITQSCEA